MTEKRTKAEGFMLRMPDGLRDRVKAYAEKNGRSMNTEIVRALEESFPAKVDGAAVKALEWVHISNGAIAHTPFGMYKTTFNRNGRSTHSHEMIPAGGTLPVSYHNSVEDAKDAAQADYEQRIRSALA